MVEAAEKLSVFSFAQLAREMLEDLDGNVEKAKSALEYKLKNDPKLRALIIDEALALAIDDRMRRVSRSNRENIISKLHRATAANAAAARASGQNRVRALAEGLLFSFPLLGGHKKLGDGTKVDIEDTAHYYEKSSNDAGHKARWLRLIAARIPERKKASDVWSDEDIQELWRKPQMSTSPDVAHKCADKTSMIARASGHPHSPQRIGSLDTMVYDRAEIDHGDVGARSQTENQAEKSPSVAVIVELWRQRQAWHRAEKTLVLQAQARCRAFTGGDKTKAAALWKQALAGKDVPLQLLTNLMPFLAAIKYFQEHRKPIEKTLTRLASSSPHWPFVKDVRGFGALNLAALIGECGDILAYRNPSCLWKRMGLAVIDGERQRKCTDAEKALIHGYSPQRRSVAFNIGDCMIKAKSPYKAVYDERKAQKTAAEWTPIHAHRDAARYMVKRVLRDLWVAAQANSP